MQSSTLFILACLVAAVTARALEEPVAAEELAQEFQVPEQEGQSNVRDKRYLLLLKKKLLLGALGLKAAKIGAVGIGAVGALAYKSKPKSIVHIIPSHSHSSYYGYHSHAPHWNAQVHSWSG